MKSILLIVDTFPPYAAPRMGVLCKYLKKNGWQPYVVVSDDLSLGKYSENLVGYAEAHFIPKRSSTPMSRFLNRVRQRYAAQTVPFCDEQEMERTACRLVVEHNIKIVLSSTFSTFPLPIAYRVSKKFHIPLVVDLRDIEEQWPTPLWIKRTRRFFYFHYKQILRNFILRRAATVTTVSKWHTEILSKYNRNVHLIFNGFDPEIFFERELEKTKQFTLLHAGTFSQIGVRDPELLFAATAQLFAEGSIDKSTYRIQLYCGGQLTPAWQERADRYQVNEFIDVLDFLPGREMPRIMNAASILLLLANKVTAHGPKGIMTTKLFEYLAMNRPILLIRSDEDCLEQTIRDCNAGAAARTVEEAADFIREQYFFWRQHGYTAGTVDREKIQPYSRKEQAFQFMSLFEQLMAETAHSGTPVSH